MNMIELRKVNASDMVHVNLLYELLSERDPEANISHRIMPSFDQHRHFVETHPYHAWYIIVTDGVMVGSIYLTEPAKPSRAGDEIGIAMLKEHQRKGYAKQAIVHLMQMHPRPRYLANIALGNYKSQDLFSGLGFEACQMTYELFPKKPGSGSLIHPDLV